MSWLPLIFSLKEASSVFITGISSSTARLKPSMRAMRAFSPTPIMAALPCMWLAPGARNSSLRLATSNTAASTMVWMSYYEPWIR
ncbi:MAG: hypothetical protein MO853_04505 [Candidatus Protistobacter heckmanni]|nr:hypothetical protein [Candidatus Protistobacter heckmanni]